MPTLRLVAWNCHHGTLNNRIALLKPHQPDIVFLQECRPATERPLYGHFLRLRVNGKKQIALGSVSQDYELRALAPRKGRGRASLAADVSGSLSFAVLGIWSQLGTGRRYVDDVLRSLDAYDDVLRSRPTVVMGDLNSGPHMNGSTTLSKGHARLLAAFTALDMVSTYHLFHKVDHGCELDATYRHLFKATEPWHIDFCFVPKTWARNVTSVQVLDGGNWRRESDHHPLRVDLRFG